MTSIGFFRMKNRHQRTKRKKMTVEQVSIVKRVKQIFPSYLRIVKKGDAISYLSYKNKCV